MGVGVGVEAMGAETGAATGAETGAARGVETEAGLIECGESGGLLRATGEAGGSVERVGAEGRAEAS